MNRLPGFLRALSGKKVDPVIIAVIDRNARGTKGNARRTLNFLKYHGLKLALDNVGMMSSLGMDAFDLSVSSQETLYLTNQEKAEEGYASLASANMLGLPNSHALQPTFFNDHIFGNK